MKDAHLLTSYFITYLCRQRQRRNGDYYDTCQVVVDFPEINGLYYEIQDDNTVVIIGYDGIDSEVVIPDEIEGMPVVAIRIFAFFGEQNLESVIIGDYVVDIGESAFMLCENLKYVKLGEAVKTIHGKGFAVCSQLEEINFPDSLEYIKEYAFADCISLETFIIPENAKEVQISLPGHLTGSVKIINLSKLGFTNYQLAQLSDAYYSSNYDEWYSLPMGGEQLTSLASGGTAYRQYPILYHTRNNHVGDNPVRHGIESDVILNPIPDQIIDEVTYRFEGWYMDEQYTQKISKIERTLREPITLYAKQTPKTASKNSSDSDSSKSEVNYQQNNYLAKVNTSPAQTDGIVVNQGNWKQQGDNWSFVDINGQLVKSRWVFDQERWYFIDQNGIMVTGWMMVDGHWYLLYQDGAMIIGWKYVNGQ